MSPTHEIISTSEHEIGLVLLFKEMWATAPFRTLFVGLPFIVLMHALLVSNILYPIYRKLTVQEGGSKDG